MREVLHADIVGDDLRRIRSCCPPRIDTIAPARRCERAGLLKQRQWRVLGLCERACDAHDALGLHWL
jgi:hypothetical protein